MAGDSFNLAGYELLGGVTAFSLVKDTFDLGVAQPDTAYISSLLIDGDQQTSDVTHSRTVTLTLLVRPSSRLDLSVQTNALALALNVRRGVTYPLTWTPGGGLSVIYDCQRATVSQPHSIVRDNQLVSYVTVSFLATPFGRSPAQQSITVTARSQLDSFDTAPTGATLDTTTKIEGTGSAKATGTLGAHDFNSAIYNFAAPVTRSFTARDYSAFSNVAIQTGFTYASHVTTFNLTLTLTSASGSTTYPLAQVTYGSSSPFWQIATVSLTGGTVTSGTGVTLTAVTSYSLAPSARVVLPGPSPAGTVTLNLDDAEMTGASTTIASTTRGALLLVPNVVGSARTPVSLAAVGTINSLLAHRPPSDQDANLQILTGVNVAASPSHPAATTIQANNAHFNGTYSAVLGVSGNGATGANTVTVTVTQLANGASVASQVFTGSYTSPLSDRLVRLGEITLPLRRVPSDNTTTTYTIDINHTAGADTYSDLMLLDTRGQTVIADPPSAVNAVYLDAPTGLLELGAVYASATGNRSDAYCIDDTSLPLGGPFQFEPGNNRMLIWSDTAAPTLTTSYYPLWLLERAA
jgi:hypothetical protein